MIGSKSCGGTNWGTYVYHRNKKATDFSGFVFLFGGEGGFKSSVDKEEATQFFRVRLWDQGDLIDQVLAHYDKLDEEIRTELPLKRIWVVAEPAE